MARAPDHGAASVEADPTEQGLTAKGFHRRRHEPERPDAGAGTPTPSLTTATLIGGSLALAGGDHARAPTTAAGAAGRGYACRRPANPGRGDRSRIRYRPPRCRASCAVHDREDSAARSWRSLD